MSENRRSFFATIPGLVTGLAGLLTGIVGLVTVLIQLGVIGGDDGNGTPNSVTTVAGATTAAGAGATPTTEAPRLSVNPSTVDFKLGDPPNKKVTVRNETSTTTITVSSPQVTGSDRSQFSATGCSAPVRPGLSCELTVTFTPSGPLRSYQASLQITAPGARGEEVRLSASTLLG